MIKKSKKMQEALKKVDATRAYSVKEAVTLARDTDIAKFDATVEVTYKLNVSPKEADQRIRGAIVLPNGTGKTQAVLVFARGEETKEAEAVGADFVGDDDMVAKIQGGWFDFDIVVVISDMIAIAGKLGRVLGPKGLMPNPKTGTVAMDITEAVEEAKAGKVAYRVDRAGDVHVPIGRVSSDNGRLVENFNATNDVLLEARPSTAEGQYIKNVSVTTTFGPGIHVDRAPF